MIPEITYVKAMDDYKLFVKFKQSQARLFDVKPYLSKGVFKELRNDRYFKKVRIVWGGVEWPHKQDLSAETLYCLGTSIESLPERKKAA